MTEKYGEKRAFSSEKGLCTHQGCIQMTAVLSLREDPLGNGVLAPAPPPPPPPGAAGTQQAAPKPYCALLLEGSLVCSVSCRIKQWLKSSSSASFLPDENDSISLA